MEFESLLNAANSPTATITEEEKKKMVFAIETYACYTIERTLGISLDPYKDFFWPKEADLPSYQKQVLFTRLVEYISRKLVLSGCTTLDQYIDYYLENIYPQKINNIYQELHLPPLSPFSEIDWEITNTWENPEYLDFDNPVIEDSSEITEWLYLIWGKLNQILYCEIKYRYPKHCF